MGFISRFKKAWNAGYSGPSDVRSESIMEKLCAETGVVYSFAQIENGYVLLEFRYNGAHPTVWYAESDVACSERITARLVELKLERENQKGPIGKLQNIAFTAEQAQKAQKMRAMQQQMYDDAAAMANPYGTLR